jgi:peptidoglycan L-alanyl-D-glutamate endopeptidase CwlK
MKFQLSARSERNLKDVHPDLNRLVRAAIEDTEVDFTVIEGRRTSDRQSEMVKTGKSKAKNPRHVGGFAVDLAAIVGNAVSWDMHYYIKINEAFERASKKTGIPFQWGGKWKKPVDGPHFQLPRKQYPDT